MLHTKPQGHWPFGSGEEDFWRVFTKYGRGGDLGHVTPPPPPPANKLSFPRPMEALHEIWLWLAQQFWRRRSLKMVNRRTDDNGWQTDYGACLYYKLTNEFMGSGELKIQRKDVSLPWLWGFHYPPWVYLSLNHSAVVQSANTQKYVTVHILKINMFNTVTF